MNKNIENIFEKLPSPVSIGEYSCEQFYDSNLWIVKDINGNCGLLIDNAIDSQSLGEYKNLEKKRFLEFESENTKYKNVLLVIHNHNVIPEIFSESLNVYFNKKLKKHIM